VACIEGIVMSQLEMLMLVALGFAVAALIALFVMRAVWVSGVSLGRRRMERQAPIASAELQADRRRVRAEFAMMQLWDSVVAPPDSTR
jgi:hypothetical protein